MIKRSFDVFFALAGLLLLSPVLVAITLVIRLIEGEPIFYRQERVGRGGGLFRIWKFRTMQIDAERRGPTITQAGDRRVTLIGGYLRKAKLDELPQLVNVLVGEMSFVGPRPEVPQYVALYTAEQRRVLELKPGITDMATLEFRNEEELLARSARPEMFYREYCLPRKIALNLEYAARASLVTDIVIIIRTLAAIVRP